MKKSFWLPQIIAVITLVMALACHGDGKEISTKTIPTATVLITAADGSVIDDFYFVWKGAEISIEYVDADFENLPIVFDTQNNVMGIWGRELKLDDCSEGDKCYVPKYFYIDFYMPQSRLQELYDDIIRYDIKSYSELGIISNPDRMSVHPTYFKLTFRISGMMYSITGCDSVCASGIGNLCAFGGLITNKYYVDTDEYQSFPHRVP